MNQKRNPREALKARVKSLSTAQLIDLHGKTLALYYEVPLDESPAHTIVIGFIAEELAERGIAMTECCYCPEGHHDPKTCDFTAPNPLTEAADLIMEAIQHAC